MPFPILGIRDPAALLPAQIQFAKAVCYFPPRPQEWTGGVGRFHEVCCSLDLKCLPQDHLLKAGPGLSTIRRWWDLSEVGPSESF